MKNIALTLILTLASSAAFASSLYIVEPMNCTGQIYGDTSQVDPSYTQLALTINSARSMRKDGTLANSIEVNEEYFGPKEAVTFKHVAGTGGWYMGPLTIELDQVTRKNVSGRGDDLNLKVVGTYHKHGRSYDKLEGTWFQPDSVAGAYGYKLTCAAVVVEEASLVIDQTAK